MLTYEVVLAYGGNAPLNCPILPLLLPDLLTIFVVLKQQVNNPPYR